jgi:hypothetical protein
MDVHIPLWLLHAAGYAGAAVVIGFALIGVFFLWVFKDGIGFRR